MHPRIRSLGSVARAQGMLTRAGEVDSGGTAWGLERALQPLVKSDQWSFAFPKAGVVLIQE